MTVQQKKYKYSSAKKQNKTVQIFLQIGDSSAKKNNTSTVQQKKTAQIYLQIGDSSAKKQQQKTIQIQFSNKKQKKQYKYICK